MGNDKYGFDDIVDAQQGIFANGAASIADESAMASHSMVKSRPTQEGLVYDLSCPYCGERKPIVVEWAELIAVRHGISPHIAYQGRPVLKGPPTPWVFDPNEQGFFPDGAQDQRGMPCRCSNRIKLTITMQEIDGKLGAAQRNGLLNPEMVQQLSQLCMAVKQQRGMR